MGKPRVRGWQALRFMSEGAFPLADINVRGPSRPLPGP